MNKHNPEEQTQQSFIAETRMKYPKGTDRELLMTCSPAGFKMPKLLRIIFSKWAAKMGYRTGTPDVLILEPRGEFHGLLIEFKAGMNKPTDEQKEFIRLASNRKYCTYVAYTAQEASICLKRYLDLSSITHKTNSGIYGC